MKNKFYGEKKGSGFANMPQEKVMKEYPKQAYGVGEGYRDSLEGIDMYSKEAARKVSGQKYKY